MSLFSIRSELNRKLRISHTMGFKEHERELQLLPRPAFFSSPLFPSCIVSFEVFHTQDLFGCHCVLGKKIFTQSDFFFPRLQRFNYSKWTQTQAHSRAYVPLSHMFNLFIFPDFGVKGFYIF